MTAVAPLKFANDAAVRSEATREAILVGALAVFARSGFEAASTRAIATEAGVHHALLRYHFDNKEALWKAAISFMFDRQNAEFRAGFADHPLDASTVDGMKDFVRFYVRYCGAHPEHAAILVHEAIADTPRLDWAIDTFIKANFKTFAAPFAEHTAAGRMRLADPEIASMVLTIASQMVFVLRPHLRRLYKQDVYDPAFADRLGEAMVALLFTDAGSGSGN